MAVDPEGLDIDEALGPRGHLGWGQWGWLWHGGGHGIWTWGHGDG